MRVISPIQENILRLIGGIPGSSDFYLTGGTALAHFYLQHRKSNDLDFFTSKEEAIAPFSFSLEAALRENTIQTERTRGFHSFIELLASQGAQKTIVQLAQDSPFRFKPTQTFSEFPGLNVDNLVDIASNKLLALFGRSTLRDFVDIYALIKRGLFDKKTLTDMAKKKDPGFDLYWLGVAFEKIQVFQQNEPDMFLLLEPIPLQELQTFFNSWRADISRELCG